VKPEPVLDAVLRLPADQRAEFAARILDSLEDSDVIEPGHEAAWTAVIERRLREAREDPTKLTDMDAVMSRVRAAVAAHRR